LEGGKDLTSISPTDNGSVLAGIWSAANNISASGIGVSAIAATGPRPEANFSASESEVSQRRYHHHFDILFANCPI
jgi:hypothetical protein